MEKTNILHKHPSKTFHALMIFLFLLCGITSASAEGTGTIDDPFVLTAEGGTYNLSGYKFYGVFTAPTEGDFILNETYSFYTDATFETKNESMQPKFNGNFANKEYSYTVEAGKTYYVYAFAMSQSITMKFRTEAEPLELVSVSPDPKESPIFDAGTGSLNLVFNQAVTIGGCELKAGSNTETLITNVRDMYGIVDAKNYLADYYNNGTLKEGDDIIFKFIDIKRAADGVLYNGDGVLEVAFKSGPKPLMLVSSTGTPDSEVPVNTFKSYYMDNDNDGMIKLNFSDIISEVGVVTLSYGTTDGSGDDDAASSYYSENITPKILDNSIVIDLRGKLRRHADMLPGYETKFPTITLKIAGVKDANGNSAFSPGLGTIGTYNYSYNFSEVDYTVFTDWTVDGNTIGNDTKSVELWLQETGGNATFTGVEFAYTDGGNAKKAVVNVKDLTIEPDPDDATAKIITVPVPNVAMDAAKVTVTLAGVETPDGVEHEYATEFNCSGKTISDFQITSAMLHNADGDIEMINAALGTIASKTTATITTSKEVGYITWEITNPELGSLKQSYGTPNASSFDITFRGADLKCLTGHTYTFILKAWNDETESHTNSTPTIGTATFTFTGTELPYVYSDVMLLNHIGTAIPITDREQNTYTLNFSGPANVKKAVANLGSGVSENCNLTSNEDKTEWTFTIPSSVLGFDAFDINVFAEDMDGHAINKNTDNVPNMGSDDNTWLTVSFSCDFNRPDFTVEPASESTLEKIDVITFSYDGGINVSYLGGKIEIWGNRQLVKEIAMNELKRPEGYNGTDKICIVLNEPITAEGNYTVNIPGGFFTLGEENKSFISKTTTVYYTIGEPRGELTVTPASESTVEKIEKITFTYEGGINTNYNGNDDKITIYNKSTRTEAASFSRDDVKFNFDDCNNVWVELAEPITEPGIFEVTIPAEFFALGENGDYVNDQMIIYYEIKSGTSSAEVTVTPASESTLEQLDKITFTYQGGINVSYNGGNITVQKRENPTTYTDIASFAADEVKFDFADWNNMWIDFAEPITEPGIYEVTVPAGFFTLGENGNATNEAMVIYYEIKSTTPAAELVVTPASESTLEQIDKITFTYEPGINVSYNGDQKITIYKRGDRTKEEVTSFAYDDVQFDFDDASNMWIDFAEPITESGNYEVVVPEGFFNLGDNGDANDAMVIYYEIAAPLSEFVVTVNPEGGKVTEIPATIVLTVDGREMVGMDYDAKPTLTDDDNNSYDVHLDIDWSLDLNQIVLILDNGAITTDGTYTLTIPAGAIYGNDESDTYAEDIVITYIINNGTSRIDDMVANAGGKVDVYTVNGVNVLRNADAAAVKTLAKGLYIINGKKVVIK